MKLAWLFIAVLASALGGCAQFPGDADQAKARDAIVAATQGWSVAYDSRDPKAIVQLYDDEAVLWGTTAKKIAPGPTAIRDYFKDAGARPQARVAIGEQHIRVFGDTAVNSGYYTFTDLREGQLVPRPARYTFVFHNRAGRWMIVAHHSSVLP
jgi:uncharacterized protein (TIGR02246 family)